MARSLLRAEQIRDLDVVTEEEHTSEIDHFYRDLKDVTTYSGHANEYIVVNASGTGLDSKGLEYTPPSYESQYGSNGSANTVFSLTQFTYVPDTHEIMVFINGQKAEVTSNAQDATQYEETNSTTITFGAALQDEDFIEFLKYGKFDDAGGATFSGTIDNITGNGTTLETVNSGVAFDSYDAFYFGAPTTSGTWRINRTGDDMVFERYNGETWTETFRIPSTGLDTLEL
jgi:hypothetical protein